MSEDRNRGNRYQRGNRAPHRGHRLNRSESSEPRNVGTVWRAPVRGRNNGSRGTRGARGGSEQWKNGEQRRYNNQVGAGNKDNQVTGTDLGVPGSSRGRGASSQHQIRNRTLNPYKLKNMAQTPPEDLVGEIMLDKSGFPQALNNESLYSKFEVFQDMMLIILKATDFEAKPKESIVLLSKVKSSSLLSGGFSSYYSKLLGKREPFSNDATKAAFAGSINMLKLIVEKFPTSIEKILPPYSMAKLIMCQGNDFEAGTKTDFEHLEFIIESAMKQHSEVDRHNSKQDYPPPPDNFRDLGIFPNFSRDLACMQEPYLRPIEIEGGFQDVEHYLDVHFRLLREDFIQPLRIGIREYLKISENRLTRKKLTEVRIYKDVKIIKAVCTNSGLIHEINFSVENLKWVNWQTSKRFIYGSLLCLSNNNFEDIIMATLR